MIIRSIMIFMIIFIECMINMPIIIIITLLLLLLLLLSKLLNNPYNVQLYYEMNRRLFG